jgi:3-oxoacyl-[acyl-carrier protein] reductase
VQTTVSVVAGGTAGIGLAVAGRLIDAGGCVAVIGRREKGLREAESSLRAAGADDVLALQADARDEGQIRGAFEEIAARWRHVNVLVNTVGPSGAGRFEDLDDAAWTAAIDEGLLTVVRLIRHALPLLRQAPWARVVNTTAMSVQHQSPGLIAYTAAKAALASVTKNLARTLAGEDILVNAVAPGPVLTHSIRRAVRAAGGDPDDPRDAYRVMHEQYGACVDVGRVGTPEEIAEVVAFCASPKNTFMTGATVNVDGGSDFV